MEEVLHVGSSDTSTSIRDLSKNKKLIIPFLLMGMNLNFNLNGNIFFPSNNQHLNWRIISSGSTVMFNHGSHGVLEQFKQCVVEV